MTEDLKHVSKSLSSTQGSSAEEVVSVAAFIFGVVIAVALGHWVAAPLGAFAVLSAILVLRRKSASRTTWSLWMVTLVSAVFMALVWPSSTNDGERSERSKPGAGVVASPFWDAGGVRPGLLMTDTSTPWFDHPSFNNVRNNPTYHFDERDFLTAVVVGVDDSWRNEIRPRVGDQIEIRAFVVNQAEPLLASTPDRRGVAVGTRFTVGIGDTDAAARSIVGVVSAGNAEPRWIADTVSVVTDRPIELHLVRNSATWTSRCDSGSDNPAPSSEPPVRHKLPEEYLVQSFQREQVSDFAGTGALLGCGRADGSLRPGYDYSLEVLLRLEVRPGVTP